MSSVQYGFLLGAIVMGVFVGLKIVEKLDELIAIARLNNHRDR